MNMKNSDERKKEAVVLFSGNLFVGTDIKYDKNEEVLNM